MNADNKPGPEAQLPPLEKLQWLTSVSKASADNSDYAIRSGLTIADADYILKHVLTLAKEVERADRTCDEYQEALYVVCARVAQAHRDADPLLAKARSNERAEEITSTLKPLKVFKNALVRAMLEACGYRPQLPKDGIDPVRPSPEAKS